MLRTITIVDFETTGLDVQVDRVIEMAAIRCVGSQVVSQFSTLIKVPATISDEVTKITGISNQDTMHGLEEDEAFKILDSLLDDSVIVAHNAVFDLGFLHHAYMRYMGKTFGNNFIDTLTVCRDRHYYPHSLKAMCELYEVNAQQAHRAMSDVFSCWGLLMKLDADEPVDSYINKLSYLRKYGPPQWSPEHATLIPTVNRYRNHSSYNKESMLN